MATGAESSTDPFKTPLQHVFEDVGLFRRYLVIARCIYDTSSQLTDRERENVKTEATEYILRPTEGPHC